MMSHTSQHVLRGAAALLLLASGGLVAAQAVRLPADLDPESRARLPYLQRKDFDEASQKTFDVLPGRGQDGVLRGPLAFAAYNPGAAKALFDLHNAAVAGALSPHERELAIMVASRETNYSLEWNAHEPPRARRAWMRRCSRWCAPADRSRARREGRGGDPLRAPDVPRQEDGAGDLRQGGRAVRPQGRDGHGGGHEHLRRQRVLRHRGGRARARRTAGSAVAPVR